MNGLGKLILLIAVGCSSVLSVSAVELNGVVKSEHGKALGGVKIFTYAPSDEKAELLGIPLTVKRHETITDSNGLFKLPSHGRVVYFRREDLRPLTKILDLSTKKIEVTMEDGAASLWKIPTCTSVGNKANRMGVGFKVVVPNNVMVKKDDGRFEHGGYFFGYDIHGQIETMINWWESTSLEPSEKFLLESKEFSQRLWISGKFSGLEFRGLTADGKLWRRVSIRNGAITYQGNQKQSAEVFDAMIDSMCFDDSAVKW
jgi:hypothetical protein